MFCDIISVGYKENIHVGAFCVNFLISLLYLLSHVNVISFPSTILWNFRSNFDHNYSSLCYANFFTNSKLKKKNSNHPVHVVNLSNFEIGEEIL